MWDFIIAYRWNRVTLQIILMGICDTSSFDILQAY